MKSIFNYQALLGNLPDSEIPKIYKPISISPFPSEEDYKNGEYVRYFFKRVSETLFCSETTASEFEKTDTLYYNKVKINWKISGELESSKQNAEKIIGVKEYNESQIKIAEQTIPQIRKILYNPTQFYRG